MEVALENKPANKAMKYINILQLCKTWLNESRQWLLIDAKNHKKVFRYPMTPTTSTHHHLLNILALLPLKQRHPEYQASRAVATNL